MFTKTAQYYDLLYHFKDYKAATNEIASVVRRLHPNARTLLDVACGTGQHVQHFRSHFDVEGLDINADLLKVAHERCPGTAFHLGDMTQFRLGKKFDAVTCLFSSIGYVCTKERLAAALRCMAAHLNPNGVLLVEPWITPEKYWIGRVTLNQAENDKMKIAWMYTSEINGTLSIFDIHYLVGTRAGVEHFRERHEMGLFTDAEYRDAFLQSGVHAEHDPKGPFGRGLYYGVMVSARSPEDSIECRR